MCWRNFLNSDGLFRKQDENVREIIFRPYRIICKVLTEKQIVGIARIWHGARGEPEIPDRLNF